jgi:hypothetical protein
MHVRIRMAFALAVALSVAGTAAAGPEATVPRYRFKDGEKVAYVVEVTTKIETSSNGRTNVAQMTQLIDLTWEVSGVDADGKATITQTVGRVRFKAVTPRESAEYDTSSGVAPEEPRVKGIAARLDAVVGARIRATIDARGELTDVRLVEKAGGGRGEPASEWGDLGNPSSEAGFRRLMRQLIPVLPEAALTEKQTWSTTTVEPLSDGKATTERRYTCEGSEERGGRAMDKLSLTFTRQAENKAGEKLSTTNGTGAAFFDRTAGRLIESSLTHTRELEVTSDEVKLTRKVTETIALKLADPAK